jgi:hypothetical protein
MEIPYINISQIENSFKQEFEEDIIDEDFEFVNIGSEDDLDNIYNQDVIYPIMPDIDLWESFLNRSLTKKEKEFFHDYLIEKDTNLQIKFLYFNMMANGYYLIPKLTKNNGNCFWESLSHLGFGKSSEIRKNIAALLLLVKNDYSFFPNLNTCPEELFLNCNDVEVVRDKNTNLVYEYDYNMMVIDLYKNHSWTRLPMELIMMTVSRVYEINIKIFSNKSEFVQTVTVWNDEEDTVYLGHINEEHYIPITKIDDELTQNFTLIEDIIKIYPRYISAKKNYKKWINSVTTFNETSNLESFETQNEDKTNNTNNYTINQELIKDLDEIKDFTDFEVIE